MTGLCTRPRAPGRGGRRTPPWRRRAAEEPKATSSSGSPGRSARRHGASPAPPLAIPACGARSRGDPSRGGARGRARHSSSSSPASGDGRLLGVRHVAPQARQLTGRDALDLVDAESRGAAMHAGRGTQASPGHQLRPHDPQLSSTNTGPPACLYNRARPPPPDEGVRVHGAEDFRHLTQDGRSESKNEHNQQVRIDHGSPKERDCSRPPRLHSGHMRARTGTSGSSAPRWP